MADSNKGSWIIAGAILLGAVLIVAAMAYFRIQDRNACADWQENYRVAITHAKDFNAQRLAEKLYASKPEGCAIPS